MYLERNIKSQLFDVLHNNFSVLLLGARQTGKTTFIKTIQHDRYLNLMEYELRQRYEATPSVFINEIKALQRELARQPVIIVDEIQKVPNLTNEIQVLIDDKIAQFILTGSSARKLTNLLPGRVIKFLLRPLSLIEYTDLALSLEDILCYGTLPGIVTNLKHNCLALNSYVSLYLEEEIRKEALVRNLGAFHNFLKLACRESGQLISFRAIAQAIGVTHNTVAEYYRILQDCMLVETIAPIIKSYNRRDLIKHNKYIMFDLGVRRIGAVESLPLDSKQMGKVFEQFIGLELIKILTANLPLSSLHYWRDYSGKEIDYVICHNDIYIPIEVKLTNNPSLRDAKHLIIFQQEYANHIAKYGYIICTAPYPIDITDRIIALPWHKLQEIKYGN